MKAIKLAKLKKLLPVLRQEIKAKIDEKAAHAQVMLPAGGPAAAAAYSCLVINSLMTDALIEHGFSHARMVAGKAAFGVNKGKFGVLDYGYSQQADTLNVLGLAGDENTFYGHAWIEIPDLKIIVDALLPELQTILAMDNSMRGFNDNTCLLSKDMIVESSNTISFAKIIDEFAIGHHYQKNAELTESANIRIDNFRSVLGL
ncbi:hypothetical protein JCM19237_284 [Photobacterium aphoticum]|uniref:Uncharacterized protein n=1 Tax=Photobacterium aphoticum TaxID=754436 RepID=A0A090R1C1_9GAMM|nr:hypothetical protein JCM19237_284 [Photobacterium aphoticum]